MKWTDAQPVRAGNIKPNPDLRAMIEELSEQPGRWAVLGRYPYARRKTAWTRGSNIAKRYPGVEYAVQNEDNEFVLYFRIPA